MDRFYPLNRLGARRAGSALLLCLLVAGCGSRQGEVSGVVRRDGRPLPFGTIQLLGTDGVPRAGVIGPDGTFRVPAPAGEAKVIVRCVDEARMTHYTAQLAQASGQGRSAAPPPPPPSSAESLSLVPQRYSDWDASGLTVVVKPGKTVQDFDLASK